MLYLFNVIAYLLKSSHISLLNCEALKRLIRQNVKFNTFD